MIKRFNLSKEFKKSILFFFGLALIALGSVQMIKVSEFGVQPLDVFYIGVQNKTGLTIGTVSILTGIALLSVSYVLTREKIKLGTVLDTIFLGLFVDFLLHFDVILQPETLPLKISFLLIGLIFISLGIAITIVSDFGTGPIDTFMLAICKKFRISIKKATTLIETVACIIGFFLGGPIGVGTILVCFLLGPLTEIFLNVAKKDTLSWFTKINKKLAK